MFAHETLDALEQTDNGYRNFPFYPLELTDDPAQQEAA